MGLLTQIRLCRLRSLQSAAVLRNKPTCAVTMTALLHSAPLTSLRDFAAPLQEQPFRICRKQLHRRPVTAVRAAGSCHCERKRTQRDVKAHARVVAENPTAPEVKAGQEVEWFTVLASAEFMLHDVQNEAFAEQLRERRRLLLERDSQVNFFIVSEPAWLDENFPQQAKQVRRPCVALVSTDKQWITFMKLRLDRVLKLELGNMTPEEALKSLKPVPEFKPLNQDVHWTAPYPPYKPGWWEIFEPKH